MIKINVKDKIVEVNKMLDELDEYDDSLSTSLSITDSKISDFMHLIDIRKDKINAIRESK